jgi:hypothetical protein
MCLPTALESDEVITRALGVLERLTKLIESAEAKIEISHHLGAAGVRWTIARFAGTQRGTGDCYKEQHQGCAENYCHDLVVHASEGVVFFVEVEEACDCCSGFNAHPACVVIAGALSGGLGLNIALGEPRAMEEDDDLVVLHADDL